MVSTLAYAPDEACGGFCEGVEGSTTLATRLAGLHSASGSQRAFRLLLWFVPEADWTENKSSFRASNSRR